MQRSDCGGWIAGTGSRCSWAGGTSLNPQKFLFICCSGPLRAQGKTPLTYKVMLPCRSISVSHFSCTTPSVSHPGLSVLPRGYSQPIWLSRTQAQLREHQGPSLRSAFLSLTGAWMAVLSMGEIPGAKACSSELSGSFAIDFGGAGLHS